MRILFSSKHTGYIKNQFHPKFLEMQSLRQGVGQSLAVKQLRNVCLFFFFGGYRRKEKEPKRNARSKGDAQKEAVKTMLNAFFVRALPRHPAIF